MSSVQHYYDQSYAQNQLSLDEKGNSFNKIRGLWIEPERKINVLDLGCGTGSVSAELITRGHHVTGIDVMADAVKRACERGLNALVYDLNNPLPFEANSFDCVLALDILEHLFDPIAMLMEIQRVLDSQGYLLLFLPLHFDIRQRFRMLFGKGIVSYEHLYYDANTTAWNYFHIRFFTLHEIYNMLQLTDLVPDANPDYRPIITSDLPKLWRDIFSWQRAKKMAQHWPNLFSKGVFMRLRNQRN